MPNTKRPIIFAFIVLIVASLALTIALLLTPFPLETESFRLSRTALPLAGSCFDLTWSFDPDEGPVYLDGERFESSGTQSLCAWKTHRYTIGTGAGLHAFNVEVVTNSPLFWIIALTPIFCLIALIQLAYPRVFSWQIDTRRSSLPLRTQRGLKDEVILVLIAFIVLVILLWVPFGLGGNVNRDNWEYRGWFESGVFPMFNAPTSPQRPLTNVYEWVAYLISSETFVGYNLILIVDLVLKGVLSWLLLRRLFPSQPVIAFGAALIFVLHPIDPFALFALNVQQSVVFLLIAANLLLTYWRRPSLKMFGAAQIAGIIACAHYEGMIPLVVMLPFLLLLDVPRFDRRWISVTVLWVILPLLWLGYFVFWLTTNPSPYFAMTQGNTAGIGGTLRGIAQIYINALPGAYLDAARSLLQALRDLDSRLIFGAIAFVVAALIGWRLIRPAAPAESFTVQRALWVIVIGLAAIFLGLVMYLPSNLFIAYVYGGSHPYYGATFGAALAFGALLVFLPRRVQFIAVALIAGVSVTYLIAAHRASQVANADTARSLAAIVEVIPAVNDGAVILVLDESTGSQLNGPLLNASLDAGLRILYETRDITARLCTRPPEGDSPYECEFTSEGVNVTGYEITRDVAPYDFYRGDHEFVFYHELAIVQYDDEGIRLLEELPPEWEILTDEYNPEQWVRLTAPLPQRYETMLMPAAPYFRSEL